MSSSTNLITPVGFQTFLEIGLLDEGFVDLNLCVRVVEGTIYVCMWVAVFLSESM